MHFPGLRYEGNIEVEFREDYFKKSLRSSRFSTVMGIILYSVFGLLDTWSAPGTKEQIWLIRYAIVLPVSLITFALTYTSLYRKWMQLILQVFALVLGLGIVAMIALIPQEEAGYGTYYSGLMLVSVAAYTFFGLRLLNAVAVNLVLILALETVAFARPGTFTTQIGLMTFVNSNFFFITTNIIGIAVGYFLELYHRKDFMQRRMIEEEKNRTQELLYNILPVEIAEILKTQPKVIANYHEDVSILFADVVNFTPLSVSLDPKDLVEMLNDLFSQFDRLVEKYGVEKIKTIGDCYMVAAGIPTAKPDHARALALMGLEMLDISHHWRNKFGNKLALRIGINSGPVVAGVIGYKKFAYDLWGDTVNTASRMESHGMAGRIQISERFYDIVKDEFVLEAHGEIMVKGKGTMPVWYITGKKNPEESTTEKDSRQ